MKPIRYFDLFKIWSESYFCEQTHRHTHTHTHAHTHTSLFWHAKLGPWKAYVAVLIPPIQHLKILNLRDLRSKSINCRLTVMEHCVRAKQQWFLGHGLYICIISPLRPVRSIAICASLSGYIRNMHYWSSIMLLCHLPSALSCCSPLHISITALWLLPSRLNFY